VYLVANDPGNRSVHFFLRIAMRTIRPFHPELLPPGQRGEWLVDLRDDVGVTMRICRGGPSAPPAGAASEHERFYLVLEGTAEMQTPHEPAKTALPGELVHVACGAVATVWGGSESVWMEIVATSAPCTSPAPQAKVVPVDPGKFAGGGFGWQALIGRDMGASTMRMNVLQVAPGSGSPDYHIHEFVQIYVIQAGEMTLDIGRKRHLAQANSVVLIPAGMVHRNFNASDSVERHVSLLVPEPHEGQILDYAVSVHEREAELMQELPS
jgi:mannose-6-phosphate isomerase-like protein (cupin superfamily)